VHRAVKTNGLVIRPAHLQRESLLFWSSLTTQSSAACYRLLQKSWVHTIISDSPTPSGRRWRNALFCRCTEISESGNRSTVTTLVFSSAQQVVCYVVLIFISTKDILFSLLCVCVSVCLSVRLSTQSHWFEWTEWPIVRREMYSTRAWKVDTISVQTRYCWKRRFIGFLMI